MLNQTLSEADKLSWIKSRINDPKLIPSQTDRRIAQNALMRITESASSQDDYSCGLEGINFLVPRTKHDETVWIGDKELTNGRQRMIESRQSAREISLPEHPLYQLPPEVRRKIFQTQAMNIQLTDCCTVGCTFCAVSEKGHITKKFSLDDSKRLIHEFSSPESTHIYENGNDLLYVGSDPFDARWGDYDYLEIAKYYRTVMEERKNRRLLTSTSIPIGEELRILRFAFDFVDNALLDPSNADRSQFRISITDPNRLRAKALENILIAVYGDRWRNYIFFSENRDYTSFVAGSFWKNPQPDNLTYGDVIGIKSNDNVVITPDDVWNSVCVGSSEEIPDGNIRFPIRDASHGKLSFTIVDSYLSPPFSRQYPLFDPRFTVYDYIAWKAKYWANPSNPHRALLRVARTLHEILTDGSNDHFHTFKLQTPIPLAHRDSARQLIRKEDILVMKDHLASEHINTPMSLILKNLAESGIIDEHS